MGKQLWEILADLKSDRYQWIDLTHEFSPETPHWYGFAPLAARKLFDYNAPNVGDAWDEAPMRVYEYTVAGQYGTHVDIPAHFAPGGRTQEQIRVDELVYPLVVIDKSGAVRENPDYALTVQDILDWEKTYGEVPKGAFVAFRSDWYKRPAENFDNNDADGIPHYPGWDVAAIEFLVTQRSAGAIGHETSDTDPGFITSNPEIYPYPGEKYILDQDRIQIELLANLDQVPAVGGIIFTTFPKLKDGVGFPARVFAVVPAGE
jgi:kynurenine formamidase